VENGEEENRKWRIETVSIVKLQSFFPYSNSLFSIFRFFLKETIRGNPDERERFIEKLKAALED
jgi:hypothetical protein